MNLSHRPSKNKRAEKLQSSRNLTSVPRKRTFWHDDDDPFKTLAEEINNLREQAPELAQENVTAGIVVECDDDAATFEADPLTVEDIIAEFNFSAYANEEEEEEMDEDEIAIVDEPPKPPTQCELRHMQWACLTHSAFLLMMRTSIICAKVPGTFLKS